MPSARPIEKVRQLLLRNVSYLDKFGPCSANRSSPTYVAYSCRVGDAMRYFDHPIRFDVTSSGLIFFPYVCGFPIQPDGRPKLTLDPMCGSYRDATERHKRPCPLSDLVGVYKAFSGGSDGSLPVWMGIAVNLIRDKEWHRHFNVDPTWYEGSDRGDISFFCKSDFSLSR